MPRVVVLGTGTGVGKSYVTEALARALRRSRPTHPVMAVKPIETGIGPGARHGDATRLERASTVHPAPPHPLYAFRKPVSPHLAAREEGTSISVAAVQKWLTKSENLIALRDATIHWTLIETAGGSLSPLGPRTTNLDLARALEPAIWVLVASDSLGVLHDVSATLLAFRQLARKPDILVLSSARKPDASTGSNAAELARLGIAKPLVTFAHRDGSAARRLASAIRARALKRR